MMVDMWVEGRAREDGVLLRFHTIISTNKILREE